MDGDQNAKPGSKQWIVLIRKSPHGPLTRDEIRVLIEQKVVRHNDVACLVSSEPKENGWKFLWQFEEFDRRLTPETTPPSAEELKKREQRRKDVPPPVVSKDDVPTELIAISPEELILKSNRSRLNTEKTLLNETPPEVASAVTAPSWLSAKTISIAAGLILVVGIAYSLFQPKGEIAPPLPLATQSRQDDFSRTPTANGPLTGVSARPNVPRRMATQQTAPAVAPAVVPPPSEQAPAGRDYVNRDRGEIVREQPVFTEDDEVDPAEEITEEDIIAARAFKKKQIAKKRRVPAAIADEEENPEGEPEEE